MNEEKIVKLPIENVMPNRFQPRISFDEKAINELSESIKKHGIIQPIVVRPIGDKFEIIAGERRYKASVLAGLENIPAIVSNLDDQKSAEVALIENVQRKDLTPIEEAISYKKILDVGILTQTELASKLGKEQSTIANKLRLLNLNEDVQENLLKGKISERHARSLLRLDSNKQIEMCNRIMNERLTVRQTDSEISNILEGPKSESKEELEIIDFSKDESPKTEQSSNSNEAQSSKEVSGFDLLNEIENQENTKQDVEPKTQNPGFIDVDKIEKEAKDIFEPRQDKKDLEEILNRKEKKDEYKSNKFFSFVPDEDENVDVSNDIYENLDLDFNRDEPKEEKNNEEQPKEEFYQGFGNSNEVSSPNDELKTSTSETTQKFEDVFDDKSNDLSSKNEDNKATEPSFSFDFEGLEESIKNDIENEEKQPKKTKSDNESSDKTAKNEFDFNFDFTKLDGSPEETKNEFAPFKTEQTNPENNQSQKVMLNPVDEIKANINNLNEKGSNVKVEEFDLGDMVQLIIKINK